MSLIQRQGATNALFGQFQIALLFLDETQAIERFIKIGPQGNCLAETGFGIYETPSSHLKKANPQDELRVTGPNRCRLSAGGFGLIQTFHPVQQQVQIVISISMQWLYFDNTPIASLCLDKALPFVKQ